MIVLDERRRAERLELLSNAFLSAADSEMRAARGQLDLDADGNPLHFWLQGEASASLSVGEERSRRASVSADRVEVLFEGRERLGPATFEGNVEARYGRALATAGEARFDGEAMMTLTGAPRVMDSSLLEIEGDRVRLWFDEDARVELTGGVSARFLPDRLDWLPGDAAAAGVTGGTALLHSGTGRGTFREGVRLLFGTNLLTADTLAVDAEGRSLDASGGVWTAFAFAPAAAPEEAPEDVLAAESGPPAADPEPEFRFEGRAERFSYDAHANRFTYRGEPQIEQHSAEGVSRVRADRIAGELDPDGALAEVVGEHRALFERGTDRVSGSRVRYQPGPDRLDAWGTPAAADLEGKLTRGGRLELRFSESRSEVYPTNTGRAFARVRLEEAEETSAAPRSGRSGRPPR